MLHDPYENSAASVTAPAETCFAIEPSDTDELQVGTKAIFVGTGGDVTLRLIADEEDVVFRNLASGSVLDVRVRAVRASGTTATDIVGLV